MIQTSSTNNVFKDFKARYYVNERNGDLFFTIRVKQSVKYIDSDRFIEVHPYDVKYATSDRMVWIRKDSLKEISREEWKKLREAKGKA